LFPTASVGFSRLVMSGGFLTFNVGCAWFMHFGPECGGSKVEERTRQGIKKTGIRGENATLSQEPPRHN
jgi:hypothetical protein